LTALFVRYFCFLYLRIRQGIGFSGLILYTNYQLASNMIPFIDNHKIRAKKVILEIFELLLTQRWHKYHFIDLHNQKTKPEIMAQERLSIHGQSPLSR